MDLGRISNGELESRLVQLAANERGVIAAVVVHLAECERRRAFAEWGYSSLFDYVTRGLEYSRAAAMRRIKAARCIAKFPQVGTMLLENKCSLSAIQIFADVITVENADELLGKVAGQSESVVEQIAAKYGRAVAAVGESIKPVAVEKSVGAGNSDESSWFRSGTNCKNDREFGSEQAVEVQHRVQFCADERFMEKLERVMNLTMSGGTKAPTLVATLEKALDEYLKRHCPEERQKRRVQLQSKRDKVKPAAMDRGVKAVKGERYCSPMVKDQVLERDGYQCSYVSESGVRCSCRWGLELDHVVPVGRGGRSVVENLRVLCRTHNLLAAEESYGREFMERFRTG